MKGYTSETSETLHLLDTADVVRPHFLNLHFWLQALSTDWAKSKTEIPFPITIRWRSKKDFPSTHPSFR